eukprot:403339427
MEDIRLTNYDRVNSFDIDFQHYFKPESDIYFIRIVDQVSSLNQITRSLLQFEENYDPYEHSSILSQERKGYNVIITEIASDIYNTLDVQNMQMKRGLSQHSVILTEEEFFSQNMQKPLKDFNFTQYSMPQPSETSQHKMETLFQTIRHKLFDKLTLHDNIYVFSYNKTLLQMNIKELRENQKFIKTRYLQIDSRHKCVPTDWYLGFDTFAIYTFLQLSGSKGFMKPLMKDWIIDYSKEFNQYLTAGSGLFSYMYGKFKFCIFIFVELLMMGSMIAVHESLMKTLIIELCKHTRHNQLMLSITAIAKILSLSTVYLIQRSLSSNKVTFMCLTCLLSYKFATLLLVNSRYFYKFMQWLMIYTYLFYFYIQCYPHANLKFIHFLYFVSVFYQLLHNMNKFSFQFEHLISLLESGFEHLVTVNIRNAITRRVEQHLYDALIINQNANVERNRGNLIESINDLNNQNRNTIIQENLSEQNNAQESVNYQQSDTSAEQQDIVQIEEKQIRMAIIQMSNKAQTFMKFD